MQLVTLLSAPNYCSEFDRMATQRRCMSEMAFTFAAPNAVHYTDADVKQIDIPSFSGSFGIPPHHVPAHA